MLRGLLFLGLIVLFVSACGVNTPQKVSSSPKVIHDSGPDRDVEVHHIPNAVPRKDPITRAGNKTPYTVLGKTYHVNFDTAGFEQTGYASWYGKKFHGRSTSNGERYDMFGMTAAHKTLPIPSYVNVVNLENGKHVIVRVNDRGPFHDGRIIDLSYTAAKKLGFHNKGTAKVKIEIIDPEAPQVAKTVKKIQNDVKPAPASQTVKESVAASSAIQTFLQVGAFSQKQGAESLQNKLLALTGYNTQIKVDDQSQFHKVLVGPIKDNFDLMILRRVILDANLPEPHLVEL